MLRKIRKIIERSQVSKLEKDAADVDDDCKAHPTDLHIIKSTRVQTLNSRCSSEIVANHDNKPVIPVVNTPPISNGVAMHNNLAMQMQNIQNQSVYQITNCTGVHVGPVLISSGRRSPAAAVNGHSPSKQAICEGKRIPRTKTTSIAAMMKCNDPLEFAALNIIAENLGQGWRDVIRQLGFSDGKIEQLHEENAVKGIKEVIYQFLKDWTERDENATIGSISKLLWINHWEVVYLLKEHWKANKRPGETGE